jgi:diadenosine tetraphosphate (Ap4A) HIT family hydrolase
LDYVIGKAVEGCGMCAHLHGDEVIWSDRHWAVLRVGESAGCFHVVCRRHVEGLWNLSEEEAQSYGALLRRLTGEIARACNPERVFVISMGEKSHHMHAAVMPRLEGMSPDPRFLDAILAHYGSLKDSRRADAVAAAVSKGLSKPN